MRKRATAAVSGSISTPSTLARILRIASAGGCTAPPVNGGRSLTAWADSVPVVHHCHTQVVRGEDQEVSGAARRVDGAHQVFVAEGVSRTHQGFVENQLRDIVRSLHQGVPGTPVRTQHAQQVPIGQPVIDAGSPLVAG